MRRLTTLLFAGALLCASRARADELPKLLVLPVQAGANVPSGDGAAVENLVLGALHDTGRFRVIGRADLAAIIGLEQQRQLAGCDDDGCMTQIAGALDVKVAAALSVDRLGETTLLTLRLIATDEAQVLARSQTTFVGADKATAAVTELVGTLLTDFDSRAAEKSATTPTKELATTAAPANGELIAPLPAELDPHSALARGAGPEALAAFSRAVASEENGLFDPEGAEGAWAAVAAVGRGNPFRQAAAARALAWRAVVHRRQDDVAHALAVVRSDKIDDGYKRTVLDDLGRTWGEPTFLPVLAETVPLTMRRELCHPRIAGNDGAVRLTVRALDAEGLPVRAEASLDGVDLGPAGRVYRVPACATELTLVDTKRDLVFTRDLGLAGKSELEVVARFPGPRFRADDEMVHDGDRNLSWERPVPMDAHPRAWAGTYCAEDHNAGGGWRLPTTAELASLHVDGTVAGEDHVTFATSPDGWYWSEDGAVLFDDLATSPDESKRFGPRPKADGAAFVRCVRSVPRFAVRAGFGPHTSGLGAGLEARLGGPFLLGVAFGTWGFDASLTYGGGLDASGFYATVHVATSQPGFFGAEPGSSVGGGVTVGADLRPLHWLSVELGAGLSLAPGTTKPVAPFGEVNVGPVF